MTTAYTTGQNKTPVCSGLLTVNYLLHSNYITLLENVCVCMFDYVAFLYLWIAQNA